MRDILSDLEQGSQLSDPDPVRRAQKQMLKPLPKRFYSEAGVSEAEGGFAVTLDGKGGLKHVKIDESLMKPEEREIVEDLLVAAHADARARLDQTMAERMKELTGGLPLPPGMKLF